MKRNVFLFAAALAIAWAGCTEDELIDNGIPVETGDEIIFGSTLNSDYNTADTRTVYGERTDTGIPVYWEPNGTDEIAIFCPQASAPASHLVNYKIYTNGDEQADASKVVKVDPESAGLQWGSVDEHKFFALYPANIVHSTDKDDQEGIITGYLPTLQQPTGWRKTVDPTTREYVYRGEPNMDYAFMFAYSKVKKSEMTDEKGIDLQFQNLVTVLDITIPGPTSGSVTVTNVNVDVVDGADMDICGYFNMSIAEADESEPVGHVDCKPNDAMNSGIVTNRISIPCYGDTDGDGKKEFVTLKEGEKINVKAYVIPDSHRNSQFRNFKISVATLNGATRTITLENPSGSPAIIPHKISRILLSNLTTSDAPDNWMSNLDPNIYLTELSIPGSKMSYLTEANGAVPVFQNKTISEQFEDGIRAFIVQTGVEATYKRKFVWTDWEYTLDKTEPITMPIVGAGAGKQLESTLDEIIKSIETTKQERPNDYKEFAFLLLTADFTYNATNYGHFDDGRIWVEGAAEKLRTLKSDSKYGKYIYTDEITANTVLDDVKGKIVIKVNYNDNSQKQWVDKGDVLPALFSLWEVPPTPYYLISTNLYWGTLDAGTVRTPMKWMYQEVTNIPREAPEKAKIDGVLGLFKEGVKAYKENTAHDTWFMNDLGGAYRNADNALQENPTTRIAEKFNQLAIDALQERTENASTGLVFMNFADRDPNSGGLYRSDYIIATVIDNNFKFALRKKPSSAQ